MSCLPCCATTKNTWVQLMSKLQAINRRAWHMILFACFIFSSAALAGQTSLEYKGFYQRLKQFHKGDYQLVELTFSVPKAKGCILQGANIKGETGQYPLVYNQEQRLFFPFDEQIKSERTLVNLIFDGDGQDCSIAMQLRSKRTKMQYNQQELLQTFNELNQASKKLQGFPLKYFTQDILGLQFSFENDTSLMVNDKKIKQSVDRKISLSKQDLEKFSTISLTDYPKFISPWNGV